jgi:hypothetical protein
MSTANSWIIGGLFLVTADLCVSIFTTLQVIGSKCVVAVHINCLC